MDFAEATALHCSPNDSDLRIVLSDNGKHHVDIIPYINTDFSVQQYELQVTITTILNATV